MKYTLIEEKGRHALILRGENMTQYAVVSGLNKETESWDWTCCYYDFGKFSELTKAEALFKALDYYLAQTDEKHISWDRMSEIATVLKDGLIENDKEEAYYYMAATAELSASEAEYFGLDLEWFKDDEDEEGGGTDSTPSKIQEILDAQTKYMIRYGGPSEEDHSLNDSNIALILAMSECYGQVYVGTFNGDISLVKYEGEKICTAMYDFCVPDYDEQLESLLRQWKTTLSVSVLESINERIRSLNGHTLIWV